MTGTRTDFKTALENGDTILVAEGYVREFGRRGYLKMGPFIPEVVLDYPHLVQNMYEEFAHAGSDVVEALTYYGHREKLRLIGREDELEKLNRSALKMARKVADDHNKWMAAGICNSAVYEPDDEKARSETKQIFQEQIEWAVEENADYIIGETFNDYGEAALALQSIQEFGKGLPAVITLTAYFPDVTTDNVPLPEACRRLEEHGAAVVGLNCGRGPRTMIPLIKEIKKVCKGPIAALPVPFRTTDECKTFQSLKDPETGKPVYPNDLECVRCSNSDIRYFAEEAKEIGIKYVGLCCGNCGQYFRELAEAFGRRPLASKYSTDMKKNQFLGATKGNVNTARADLIRDFVYGNYRHENC
ncbi:betaine--homocysteine S-methyltransferase 1-like [Mytilus californianus]|uniref:betaine--homocysteine S-methyltransferase 1-like n=1 Tax=Mytilus californianus TaxID=6549 RepID=UPI002247474E|nr:betaine--homocysteine S-methyltransferase 1-like [Mytilus californianus]